MCDGTDLDVAAECKYRKTIGTTYSESVSEQMSVSSEVYSEIQAGMFGIMSTLGASINTGYDWTQISEATMSEEESFEVLAVVPPGKKLYIEQAIGHCNGNTAKTEMFKLTHTVGKEGEETVVEVWYEGASKNGTTVVVDRV